MRVTGPLFVMWRLCKNTLQDTLQIFNDYAAAANDDGFNNNDNQDDNNYNVIIYGKDICDTSLGSSEWKSVITRGR